MNDKESTHILFSNASRIYPVELNRIVGRSVKKCCVISVRSNIDLYVKKNLLLQSHTINLKGNKRYRIILQGLSTHDL